MKNETDELKEQTVSLTLLRRHLGIYLARAQSGECFIITRYGGPVAALVPPHIMPRSRRAKLQAQRPASP